MKKQKENKPIIIDDLENLLDEEQDLRCKHCGAHYIITKGFDENYCSQECMEADQDE